MIRLGIEYNKVWAVVLLGRQLFAKEEYGQHGEPGDIIGGLAIGCKSRCS